MMPTNVKLPPSYFDFKIVYSQMEVKMLTLEVINPQGPGGGVNLPPSKIAKNAPMGLNVCRMV